jgi:cytoskeleton protein RodZ
MGNAGGRGIMEQRTDAGLDAFVGGAPPLPPGDHSDLSVGEVLRRNRIFYEKTISDVESVLRIRAAYLEALERGEFNRLPGRVYAIGFVRSYAEYLGLDPDAMIRKFKAQAGGYSVKREFTLPVPASESRAPGRWVVVSSAACAVVAFSVWLIFSQTNRAVAPVLPAPEPVAAAPVSASPESAPAPSAPVEAVLPAAEEGPAVPPVPDEKAGQAAAAIEPAVGLAVAPPVEEPLTAPEQSTDISFTPPVAAAPQIAPEQDAASVPESTPDPDVIAPPGGAAHRVLIKAIQSTWIEIRDPEGVVLLSSILKAGDMYFVPDRKGLLLSTGNAGGFEVEVDGKPVPRLGEIGDVRRGVSIDPDVLAD